MLGGFKLWGEISIHNDRDKDRRLEAFEKNIGQRLENRVRDEEHGQSCVVSSGGHLIQTLLQSIDFGISDICSIQECQKIQNTKLLSN
jgi:hypothetical protein